MLVYPNIFIVQLSKLACIPFTLAIQYFLYSQSVSRKVQLTLVPITFGVGFATVYDLDINFAGLCKCHLLTLPTKSIAITHLFWYIYIRMLT
jgi:hypothetical protein